MRLSLLTLTVAALFMIAACGNQTPPAETAVSAEATAAASPTPVANSRQIMLGLVIPAADIIWGVASAAPADDAAWEKVQANAVMIAEGGNLMMTGPRVVDQADWMAYSKAMVDAAMAAAQGAAEKNVDKVSEAGNTMYDTCDTCHKKYMTARQGQ